MLQYHSILGVNKMPIGMPCIAFYKYDGSNMRFEWSPKKGWNKFGSRTQMIDSKTPILGESIDLFQDTMGQIIIDRLKWKLHKTFNNLQRITVFAEFLGENSFAGTHVETDEKKLILFDVFLFQKGFLQPQQFVDYFGDLDFSAKVLYNGNLNKEFIMNVRNNKLVNCNLNEGVICKGVNPNMSKTMSNDIWMTKIKTLDYLDRLKNKFVDNWESFAE